MPIQTQIQTMADFETTRASVVAALVSSVAQPNPNERSVVIFSDHPEHGGLLATIVRSVDALAVPGWSGPVQFTDGFHYRQWFVSRPTREIAEQIHNQLVTGPWRDAHHENGGSPSLAPTGLQSQRT